jgi:hypothetical protein
VKCTCGHIELDVPGRYCCDCHGEQIVGDLRPCTIRYVDEDER